MDTSAHPQVSEAGITGRRAADDRSRRRETGTRDGLRLGKGHRAHGADIRSLRDPDETGLGCAVKPDKGEIDGVVLRDSKPVFTGSGPHGGSAGGLATARQNHSVGASRANAWPPAELCDEGTQLGVTYFDRRHTKRVAAGPVLAPETTRTRR